MAECDGCGASVKFADLESHYSGCPKQTVICSFCSSAFLRSDLTTHNASCPKFIIPCTHASNGCPWTGSRSTLPSSHIPSCPYESIKGFFPINNARLSTLTEENITLRHKIDALEGIVQTMKREMQVVKTALGPWYRPNGSRTPFPHAAASPELPSNLQPSISRRFTVGTDILLPQSANVSHEPFTPPLPSGNADPDILAPYFPPETDRRLDSRPVRQMSASLSQIGDLNASHTHPPAHQSRPSSQNPVAPINLSTTLEGSLGGLRESIVNLTTSVESLARRNDIALTNETLRINEDVMSLRANVHGLRMQVHAIMMDRNAQVTGRAIPESQGWGESRPPESGWPPLSRFFNHPPPTLSQSPPSITKL